MVDEMYIEPVVFANLSTIFSLLSKSYAGCKKVEIIRINAIINLYAFQGKYFILEHSTIFGITLVRIPLRPFLWLNDRCIWR